MPHLVVNVTVVAVGLRRNAITGRAVGAAKVKLESKGGWLFDLSRRGRVYSIGDGLKGDGQRWGVADEGPPKEGLNIRTSRKYNVGAGVR